MPLIGVLKGAFKRPHINMPTLILYSETLRSSAEQRRNNGSRCSVLKTLHLVARGNSYTGYRQLKFELHTHIIPHESAQKVIPTFMISHHCVVTFCLYFQMPLSRTVKKGKFSKKVKLMLLASFSSSISSARYSNLFS